MLTLLKLTKELRNTREETLHARDLIAGPVHTGILGIFLRNTTFYMLW
jgi:hypothetical protein